MLNKHIKIFIFIVLSVLLGKPASAEDLGLDGATLEDLLNVKTTVAAKRVESARESAGIVTVLSAKDIRDMGARDLIDVLRLVPGLNFNFDVQGVVGMSTRGMWAYEGKMLLIVDGIEMNEPAYGTTQFGNEFPIDQIKTIEIIRGPGSVIYGGFAELAVIKITTNSGAEINGGSAEVTYGRMQNTEGRRNLSLQLGKVSSNTNYSLGAYVGQGRRGDAKYYGFDPSTPANGSIDFKNTDQESPRLLNLGISHNHFHFRALESVYNSSTSTMYNYTSSGFTFDNYFIHRSIAANYEIKPNDRLTVTPEVHYSEFNPWRQVQDSLFLAGYSKFDLRTRRVKSSLTANYDATDRLSALAGAEYVDDYAKAADFSSSTVSNAAFASGSHTANFNSRAAFAQVKYSVRDINYFAGARYENPNFTKDSFLPRVGVTKSAKNWHAKALYSEAFRTPVLQNIELAPGIRPEHTSTIEFEYGHELTSRSYTTVNLFRSLIEDPIVYFVNPVTNGDDYGNFSKSGTEGIELETKFQGQMSRGSVSYSFYHVTDNEVSRYRASLSHESFVGEPQHKITVNDSITLNAANDFQVTSNLVFLSSCYAYEYDVASGSMVLSRQHENFLANIYASRNLGVKGLSGGVGVFNLLNQDARFYQPYGGGGGETSPIPGPSRELVARLTYHSEF